MKYIQICIIMLFNLSFSYCANTEIELSRDQIINYLSERMDVSPEGIYNLEKNENGMFLDRMRSEMREIALRTLPDQLLASSEERLQKLMATNIIFFCDDPEYNKVRIEEWLMTLKLNFAMDKLIKPLPLETNNAIAKNIDYYGEKIEDVIHKHLSKYYKREDIAKALVDYKNMQIRKVNESESIYYRVPLNEDEINILINEFEKRLIDSNNRIVTRLDISNKSPFLKESEKVQIYEQNKNQVVRELIQRAYNVLAEESSDKKIASIDPDSIVPGYREIVKKRVILNKEIKEKIAIEKQKKETQAEMKEIAERYRDIALRIAESKIANVTSEPLTEDMKNIQEEKNVTEEGTINHTTLGNTENHFVRNLTIGIGAIVVFTIGILLIIKILKSMHYQKN